MSLPHDDAAQSRHNAWMDDLAKQIADLLVVGKRIEAIKMLREATGMGLAQALRAVEAVEQGDASQWLLANKSVRQADEEALPDDAIPEHVVEAAIAGKRIEAIKQLREHAGLDLKTARDRIDRAFPAANQPNEASKRGCLLPLLFGMLAGSVML